MPEKLSDSEIFDDKKKKILDTSSEDNEIIDLEDPSTEIIDIIVEPKAYLKVLFHALKYASPKIPPPAWREVIGLLVGKLKNQNTPLETLVIVDAIPVTHGSAVHAEFHDYSAIAKLHYQISPPYFICGWYHSHPSYGVFMSSDDVSTHQRYQKMWKKAVAVVIDPTLVSKKSFGWGFFRFTDDFTRWERLNIKYAKQFNPEMIPELIELYGELLDQKELVSELEEGERSA